MGGKFLLLVVEEQLYGKMKVESNIFYGCFQFIKFDIDFRGYCIGYGFLSVILYFEVVVEVIEIVLEIERLYNYGENRFLFLCGIEYLCY